MFTAVLQRIVSAIIAIIAFFCNTFGLLRQTSEVPDGAERIAYGDGICENFDIYIPDDVSDEVNVLLLVHGGAWMMGDGSEFNRYCATATDEYGFVTVNVDYNKIQNGATAATMVAGIDAAVNKVSQVLSERNINAGKMIVCGHSSGAHLALLYAYQNYKTCPIEIAFVVSNCATVDFLADVETKTATLGKYGYLVLTGLTGHVILPSEVEECQEYIDAVSPLCFITPSVPPTIVVQGTADKMVSYDNSTYLYNKLVENGVDTLRVTYEGAGHFLGSIFTEGNAQRAAAFAAFAEKYL